TRQTFGHYDIESVLGRGAMGMVYLAKDRRIGRKVALKTVHVNEKFDDESEANEFYKRLQREAELCGALQHPNIVTLYEPGYENNVIAWLATEYVEGENLRDRMRKRKPLPLDESLRIVEGILRGLAYAHAKGIVHRDIKPANILITTGGDSKIADFGIARPLDSTLTAVGEMLGTPSYMSPEQVRCQPVTTRSDLFSVGAVLYEMMTGVKAFGAPDVTGILRNVVEAIPKQAHEVNAEIPPSLSRFLEKLFAKEPEDRFATAVEALDELERIRQEIGPVGEETPELVTDAVEGGHSTLAARTVPPSVTEPDYNDATPAVGMRRSPLQREIPASVFWSVIAAALLAFGASALTIRARTDTRPTVTFTHAQVRAFEAKKEQLRGARALVLAGKFDEALKAYDAYLSRYPSSPAAREERASAAAAMEKTKAAKSRLTVTATSKHPAIEKPKEPEKKPSLFQRIFRRGSSPPKQPPSKQSPSKTKTKKP
ncbi:MAG TPA: protein kinase, partial [Thermoanaerobaculia bacterium]|nr:protein kinase [Thermoanaerobaculia bacterium]